MNAVLSVQGSAVPEKTKPSFLSRVFNKKKALKVAKVALPVAAVAAFFPDAARGGKREPQKIPPFRIVEFFGGVVRGMTTRQR
ncbi:type IV conjugative transfer system pilin TraA, partial [Klebsiella pneumoniae]|uniref:type IV conjugative transfer system pilin TraA n=1 Tax=Klebsiella pneumoniae TaxID=573 RepID=UPI0028698115